MAQHGYLREYDEGFGGDDRERSDWRDREERERRSRERGRSFMFDEDERDRFRDRDEDRGFFSRMGDEARSWFRDDERDYRAGREQSGFGGANERREGRPSYSSHPDDHYRSWRDRQMQALDNDYADYCREREQQFHRDFDSWRSQRHGNPQPLQTGMTQSGLSADPSGELQLSTEDQAPSDPGQDPTAAATLGTTSGGRRK